jgi:hypothetical protein
MMVMSASVSVPDVSDGGTFADPIRPDRADQIPPHTPRRFLGPEASSNDNASAASEQGSQPGFPVSQDRRDALGEASPGHCLIVG